MVLRFSVFKSTDIQSNICYSKPFHNTYWFQFTGPVTNFTNSNSRTIFATLIPFITHHDLNLLELWLISRIPIRIYTLKNTELYYCSNHFHYTSWSQSNGPVTNFTNSKDNLCFVLCLIYLLPIDFLQILYTCSDQHQYWLSQDPEPSYKKVFPADSIHALSFVLYTYCL